jgi:ATP-dependent DNA helicase RecG
MVNLDTEIRFLKGVGDKKAEILQKELNICTFRDLLYYFPYKYVDKSRIYKISEISQQTAYIQLKGKITGFRMEGKKPHERLIAFFNDGSSSIELIWFKGIKYIQQNYKLNTEYLVFGKPNFFNLNVNIPHPEIDVPGDTEQIGNLSLEPHYNTSEKMKNSFLNTKAIRKLVSTLFSVINGELDETLPTHFLAKHNFLSLYDALQNIHFPPSTDMLTKAQLRLKFEELFVIQLKLLYQRNNRKSQVHGHIFQTVGENFNYFYHNNLPFSLTNAQKRVIKEIRKDCGSGKQMNRLLQGDVGSGKTLVALMCMLIAIDNGYQACLMAPTEILAQQHFATISGFLKGMNVNCQLLSGTTKKSARKVISESLLNGSLHILIGTHALIEDSVQFQNLGFVVIDEQHRFGVEQRAKLWRKNSVPPHVLVMTATPIPRTLAMTLYGDLEVSVIDELPPGRKPIKTMHSYDSYRLRLFGFLKKEIAEGRQVYVVYPLIQESEKMDLKFLEDGYESMVRAFPPPQYNVTIVHGKMKAQDKDRSMQLFVSGQAQIMVATTVIEVGVNVPNATVMVIESAERFGLSQLHQLRGRVGRGGNQSYCILMTSHKLSTETRKRIDIMVSTNDGFEIAEADLKLRGPGDLEGTQQSGIPFDLKIANLAKDGQILQYARNQVEEILQDDPLLENPENELLKKALNRMKKEDENWAKIS